MKVFHMINYHDSYSGGVEGRFEQCDDHYAGMLEVIQNLEGLVRNKDVSFSVIIQTIATCILKAEKLLTDLVDKKRPHYLY